MTAAGRLCFISTFSSRINVKRTKPEVMFVRFELQLFDLESGCIGCRPGGIFCDLWDYGSADRKLWDGGNIKTLPVRGPINCNVLCDREAAKYGKLDKPTNVLIVLKPAGSF